MERIELDETAEWKIRNTWALRASELESLWLECEEVAGVGLPEPTNLTALDALVGFINGNATDEALRARLTHFLQSTPGYDPSRPVTEQNATANMHLGYVLMQLGPMGKLYQGRRWP